MIKFNRFFHLFLNLPDLLFLVFPVEILFYGTLNRLDHIIVCLCCFNYIIEDLILLTVNSPRNSQKTCYLCER